MMEERPATMAEDGSVRATEARPVIEEAQGAERLRSSEVPPSPLFPILGSVMVIGGCGYATTLFFSPSIRLITNLLLPDSSAPTSSPLSSQTPNADISPSSPDPHP